MFVTNCRASRPGFSSAGTWRRRAAFWATAIAGGSLACSAAPQSGVLNDVIGFSPVNLELVPYAQLPGTDKQIIQITAARPDDDLLYVVTEGGRIRTLAANGDNTGALANWFDVGAALLANVPNVSLAPGTSQGGLQSVAFHPDFANSAAAGYGKFYTTFVANRPANPAAFAYLGTSVYVSGNRDTVLSEWTYDFGAGAPVASSYREVFRVNMNVYDHPIKLANFNPYAQPGDADYGLLYVAHGDSSVHDPYVYNNSQTTSSALGKILRINPLPSGADRYTTPGNAYAADNDAGTLAEIYATGFRNPHTFSFHQDEQGDAYLVVGDIGRDNIEEIDLVKLVGGFGGNFGWGLREGTFQTLPTGGVTPLPANDAALNDFIYPAAQFDHDQGGSVALASSFVIDNRSDPNLEHQLVFANFAAQDGNAYHVDWHEALGARTQLADGQTPADLTQAVLRRLRLALDADGNPQTPATIYNDFKSLLGTQRSDVRFGQGEQGEMYVSSKTNGRIYLVVNTIPRLASDFNRDGLVNAEDLQLWTAAYGQSGLPDDDGDGVADGVDILAWQRQLGARPTIPVSVAALPSSTAIAEPSAAAPIAVAAAAALRTRRRRRSPITL